MPSSSLVRTPRFSTPLALSALAWLSACAANDSTSAPKPAPVERESAGVGARPAGGLSLEGWQAETFPLPPEFAPGLPTGVESLRFSPGWRDPNAEGFWSYAFVMWIDEGAPTGARLEDLLKQYYDGLMASFAAGKGKDISATPAQVDVASAGPNRFEARMRLIDAFATFAPINLRVLVDVAAEGDGRSAASIRVSPQPADHAIWRSLDAAIAEIRARGPGAH